MSSTEFDFGIKQIWENRPGIVLLLLLLFVVFVFLVVDVWRHKKRRRPGKPHKWEG